MRVAGRCSLKEVSFSASTYSNETSSSSTYSIRCLNGRFIHIKKVQILQLLAEGMSMKQVASEIDVKPGTVAFHKYRMMETLNISTNAELLGYALKRQMIIP